MLDTNLYFFIIFSFVIYLAGIVGLLLNLKNILISLLFIELTYFGIICFVIMTTVVFNLKIGFLFALLLILVAAAESAVGLGILIVVYTFEKRITYDILNELQG